MNPFVSALVSGAVDLAKLAVKGVMTFVSDEGERQRHIKELTDGVLDATRATVEDEARKNREALEQLPDPKPTVKP